MIDAPVERALAPAAAADARPRPDGLELPGPAAAAGWLAVLPVGVALGAALAGLVGPLGRALSRAPEPSELPLPEWVQDFKPEPQEHATYLLALAVPALLFWALCAWRGRRPRIADGPLATAAVAVQTLVATVAAAAFWYQGWEVHEYLPPERWLAGTALVIAVLAAARAAPRWEPLRRWRASAPAGRLRRAAAPLALAAAAAYVAVRIASSVYDDATILAAPNSVSYHLPFTLADFAAVLNGRTPGVDFAPQYSNLLPLALAPWFRQVGLTVHTFTSAMAALSALGLLLRYDVLRRVTSRPWVALALHVGWVALAFQPVEVLPDGDAGHAFDYYAMGPLRYLGPWVVGWVVAWYLGRPSPRRAALVFAAAGAAALNNLDFGVPALGAATLAVVLAGEGTLVPRPRALLALGGAALAGLAAASGALAAVAWLRSGQAVTIADLTVFLRAFPVLGFGMLPMPAFGLHWAVYGTFMAGLLVALVRVAALRGAGDRGDPDVSRERLLAGVLLYDSVFGAGALAYYVGRSHWAVLAMLFAAWGSVVVLLAWLALRAARRTFGGRRLGAIPALLAVVALGLCAGEALPLRAPEDELWPHGSRVGFQEVRYVVWAPAAAGRLRALTAPGEKVMISYPAGHLVAELAGVRNVFPFAEWQSCIVSGQLDEIVERLRAEGVTRYFGPASDELVRRVVEAGLRVEFSAELFPS